MKTSYSSSCYWFVSIWVNLLEKWAGLKKITIKAECGLFSAMKHVACAITLRQGLHRQCRSRPDNLDPCYLLGSHSTFLVSEDALLAVNFLSWCLPFVAHSHSLQTWCCFGRVVKICRLLPSHLPPSAVATGMYQEAACFWAQEFSRKQAIKRNVCCILCKIRFLYPNPQL